MVTTAAPSPQADRHQREKRYLIMMGIRVVAFIVALLVARGWVRVVAIALALVLPWIAVVIANAGPRSTAAPSTLPVNPHRRRIRPASPPRPPAS